MKSILNQTIASTHQDLHGECATKERLEHLRDGFGPRAPLYQRHDMSRETIGYCENYRVVEDPASPGHWLLKADIYYTTETVDEAMKGFSYSITERFAGNIDSAEYEVDLPYPLYKNQDFFQELIAGDERLMVGRYIRKHLDDQTISLLVSLTAFALAPLWTDIYKEHIVPRIKSLLRIVPGLHKQGSKCNLIQIVTIPGNEPFGVHFVPDRTRELECFGESHIETGLQALYEFIRTDSKSTSVGIYQARLYFDCSKNMYVLFHLQYLDGTDINIA